MQGVAPLKDEKGVTIVNAFQKILDNSTKLHSMRKTNKIWVEKGKLVFVLDTSYTLQVIC